MWQPIETAPRDGTSVLAKDNSDPAHTAQVVFYWEADWRVDDGTGCMLYAPSCRPHVARPPTHWMPLPSPPGIWQGLGDK